MYFYAYCGIIDWYNSGIHIWCSFKKKLIEDTGSPMHILPCLYMRFNILYILLVFKCNRIGRSGIKLLARSSLEPSETIEERLVSKGILRYYIHTQLASYIIYFLFLCHLYAWWICMRSSHILQMFLLDLRSQFFLGLFICLYV